MFENLKIRNRLGKAFRIIVTTCSIAAVLGVVMLIVTMTLYKNALNNYGFSQGDIGKALVAFTDTRSATRAIVGYDDDSLISQMSDTHDERKATFEQYWEIVDEVTTTSKEQEIYDSIDAKLEDYWTTEQKAIDTGKTTDPGQSAKAQNIMIDEVAPLYDEIYFRNEGLDEYQSNRRRSFSRYTFCCYPYFYHYHCCNYYCIHPCFFQDGSFHCKGNFKTFSRTGESS